MSIPQRFYLSFYLLDSVAIIRRALSLHLSGLLFSEKCLCLCRAHRLLCHFFLISGKRDENYGRRTSLQNTLSRYLVPLCQIAYFRLLPALVSRNTTARLSRQPSLCNPIPKFINFLIISGHHRSAKKTGVGVNRSALDGSSQPRQCGAGRLMPAITASGAVAGPAALIGLHAIRAA